MVLYKWSNFLNFDYQSLDITLWQIQERAHEHIHAHAHTHIHDKDI